MCIAKRGLLLLLAGVFDEIHSEQTFNAFRYAVQASSEGRRGMNLQGTPLVPRILTAFHTDLVSGTEESRFEFTVLNKAFVLTDSVTRQAE